MHAQAMSLYCSLAVHPLSTSFSMRSEVLCSNRPPAMSAYFLVYGDSSCAFRKMPLEINQISCVPLHFRAASHSILPASFTSKPKSTLLNSRTFIFLFAIPIFLRVLNPVISWPLQLSHPQPVLLYS